MSGRMIAKIVFLVLLSICALIALMCGFVIRHKNKGGGMDKFVARKIMRMRLICFLFMLVFCLVCILI